MRHAKIFGLLAVVAAALMAFAGTASADEATSSGGTSYTGTIGGVSTNPHFTGTLTITCKISTFTGKITSHGAGKTIEAHLEKLTFLECGNHTVEVKKAGTLSFHVTKTNTALLTSSGAEITVLLHSALLGTVHCIYITNNTFIGLVEGGSLPTLHATSASIPLEPTDSACGNHVTWNGNYVFDTPNELHLDDT